jgi:hypothetical protein
VKLDELKLDKNIDRLVQLPGELTYLTASYHLNKETNEKSGNLTVLKVENVEEEGKLVPGRIVKHSESASFDFGVLSLELMDKGTES